jgi:hypothetical protein
MRIGFADLAVEDGAEGGHEVLDLF